MNGYGYARVASCTPTVRLGDPAANAAAIISALEEASARHADILVFPELSVTGYTCADLFGQSALREGAVSALTEIALATGDLATVCVVGAPLQRNNRLFNCAVVMANGKIEGVVPKSFLPNYGEFYEKRWFASGHDTTGTIEVGNNTVPFGTDLLFRCHTAANRGDFKFGIEICEDLWVPVPPGTRLAVAGADIVLNLSATDELTGKHDYLVNLIRNQSARCRSAYVYASAGLGESSTDLAFSGNGIIAENGTLLAESRRYCLEPQIVFSDIDIESLRNDRIHFSSFGDNHDPEQNGQTCREIRIATKENDFELEYRNVAPYPFLDPDPAKLQARCDEISSIHAWGLLQRLRATDCRKAVVGISGGLDSTLALLVTVKAFDMLGIDRKGIIGITMPGFGTTGRTHRNAVTLMARLGVTNMEIPIAKAVTGHFEDIGHNPDKHDVTYENSQARERTQILMDMANKENAMVIGTGDLSELALGWCTYNGDQMSMYAVNTSVPKTLVRYLVEGYARNTSDGALRDTLSDVTETPVSPELLPADANGNIAQVTEDLVGPYELHDFFLHAMLRHGFGPDKILMLADKAFAGKYDRETILRWLRTFYRRFFSQQFKRSCMPDGVKVGSICLSPRGDWRMPSDATVSLWLKQLDKWVSK